MPRMLLALAVMLLLRPVAFPNVPDHGSDAAVVEDQVVHDLREFREETDPENRIALIRRFGRTRDARVTLALMEVVLQGEANGWAFTREGEFGLLLIASYTLVHHHIPKEDRVPAKYWVVALHWWERNEADVRRRAGALPK